MTRVESLKVVGLVACRLAPFGNHSKGRPIQTKNR